MLTEPPFIEGIQHHPLKVIDLGNPDLFTGEAGNPGPVAKSHHLAYVIYTSGSTGHPKGVMVEQLCIGGMGLARGYLNQPELTRKKFVENPFLPGSRMYLTGDLAKWLPDGNVAYLGRKDHQVKISGFRIEPEEIETQLVKHADIRQAVVIPVRQDTAVSLCAYVVADAPLSASDLRNHLSRNLPTDMIPADFVFLADIPLTANGKIDCKALPRPKIFHSTSLE